MSREVNLATASLAYVFDHFVLVLQTFQAEALSLKDLSLLPAHHVPIFKEDLIVLFGFVNYSEDVKWWTVFVMNLVFLTDIFYAI